MVDFERRQLQLQIAAVVIGVCAGLVALNGGALLVWLRYFDNAPPFVSVKARVLDSNGQERYVYRPGDVLQLRRDFCVDRDTPVQVGRSLRNVDTMTTVAIDATTQIYRKGCFEGGNVIELPHFIPAGKYRYSVVVRYSNNPLHDGFAELDPVYIEVVR